MCTSFSWLPVAGRAQICCSKGQHLHEFQDLHVFQDLHAFQRAWACWARAGLEFMKGTKRALEGPGVQVGHGKGTLPVCDVSDMRTICYCGYNLEDLASGTTRQACTERGKGCERHVPSCTVCAGTCTASRACEPLQTGTPWPASCVCMPHREQGLMARDRARHSCSGKCISAGAPTACPLLRVAGAWQQLKSHAQAHAAALLAVPQTSSC
jgi:hypothetical protein